MNLTNFSYELDNLLDGAELSTGGIKLFMSDPLNGDHFRANSYTGSFSTIGASEYRSVSGDIRLTQTEISINLTLVGRSGDAVNEKIHMTFDTDVYPQRVLDKIDSIVSDYFF